MILKSLSLPKTCKMRFQVIDAKKSSYWITRFEKYRHFILKNDKISRNIENYQASRFQLKSLLGLFLVLDQKNSRIAGFFSVFTPKVWPKDIARISNRTYVDPDYRFKGLLSHGNERDLRYSSTWGSTIGYKYQIDCCLQHKIKLAVVTRENIRGPGHANDFDSMYKRFKMKYPEWKMEKGYYLTCSNKDDYRCWQKLVFLNLNKKEKPKLLLHSIPQITHEEYQNKFKY